MPVTDGSVRAGSGEGTPAENTGDFQVVSLYERWRKIQYLWVKGRFQSLRRFALGVLVAVFYVGPWLPEPIIDEDGGPGRPVADVLSVAVVPG